MLQIETTEEDAAVEALMAALQEILDPEVGLNIVALGLLYRIRLLSDAVHITMTMTTPACPMGDYLCRQVEQAIHRAVPGAKTVDVQMVWDPPWTPAMMAPHAKASLGWGP